MAVAESEKLQSLLNEVLLDPATDDQIVERVPIDRFTVAPTGTLAARFQWRQLILTNLEFEGCSPRCSIQCGHPH